MATHLQKLSICLLDLATTWGSAQHHTLALMQGLQASEDFAPLLCCPPTSALAQAAQDAHIPFVAVKSRTAGYIGHILSHLRLKKHLRRPAIIHSFSDDAAHMAHSLVTARPKDMLHIHSCPTPALADIATTKILRNAHTVLCLHGPQRMAFVQQGLDAQRIFVVHSSFDIVTLPHNTVPLTDRCIFAMWGDLVEGTGVSVLLKAMAALWQRTDLMPWEVRIFGKGPLFVHLMDEAQALGVLPRLALLGLQQASTVLPLCHVFIAPAVHQDITWDSLALAWCMGLPVICTHTASYIEVARTQNALIIPPADTQALAAAMIRMMLDAKLRQTYAQAGIATRPYASHERMVRQCTAFYRDAAHHRHWPLPHVMNVEILNTLHCPAAPQE